MAPEKPKRLVRLALLVCLSGLLMLFVHGWRLGQAEWLVTTIPLNLGEANYLVQNIGLPRAGNYELQVEITRNIPYAEVVKTIEIVDAPSPIGLDWQVQRDGQSIARGDARDYLFIDRGPHSVAGAMRRILLRVPEGQDDLRWRSFGLLGHWTAARGIGRFRVDAPTDIQLSLTVTEPLATLLPAKPRLVLRHERLEWDKHYRKLRPFGYTAVITLALGLVLLAAGLLWRLLARR